MREEDALHEHTCTACAMNFVFRAIISVTYIAQKADCLNDAPHELKLSKTHPLRFSRMHCIHCQFAREPTKEEFEKLGTAKDHT